MTTESTRKTEALFLEDTYQVEVSARVTSVVTAADGSVVVTADRTIFFPQGGGQPSDTGEILGPSGKLQVERAAWDGQEIRHYSRVESGELEPGDTVTLRIDAEKRMLHARIHSAGELICAAIRNLGYERWRVAGAIHYPERASVEYFGSIPPEERGGLKDGLQVEIDRLIETGGTVKLTTVPSREEAEKLCGFFPDYLPKDEAIRVVTVHGNVGRPCQGTHVSDIREIGGVSITKVKARKGRTKISYSMA